MTKFLTYIFFVSLNLISIPAFGAFSINLQAGDLKANPTGTSALANGSLLLLIAAGSDGVFDNNLTAGQYYGGDDVLIAAFGSNNNLGGSNATINPLSNLSGPQGEALELRWFPQISFSSYNASSPNTLSGENYGDFAGSTSGSPNGGNPWVVPASGTYSLNFVTQSLNSTTGAGLSDAEPNSAGDASSTISSVPEPTSLSTMAGVIALGAMMLRRRR